MLLRARLLLTLVAALNDKHIRALVIASLVATCRLAPPRHRLTSARGLTFHTTVRGVDRVHRNAAVGRANALPAIASGFADRDIFVVGVANLADGRHALD